MPTISGVAKKHRNRNAFLRDERARRSEISGSSTLMQRSGKAFDSKTVRVLKSNQLSGAVLAFAAQKFRSRDFRERTRC